MGSLWYSWGIPSHLLAFFAPNGQCRPMTLIIAPLGLLQFPGHLHPNLCCQTQHPSQPVPLDLVQLQPPGLPSQLSDSADRGGHGCVVLWIQCFSLGADLNSQCILKTFSNLSANLGHSPSLQNYLLSFRVGLICGFECPQWAHIWVLEYKVPVAYDKNMVTKMRHQLPPGTASVLTHMTWPFVVTRAKKENGKRVRKLQSISPGRELSIC